MHISSAIKNFTQVSLLGVLLAFCLSVSTCAAGEVIITEGMVCVDKDGIVASSEESVGEFWFGEITKVVIYRRFVGFLRAETVGFSGDQF